MTMIHSIGRTLAIFSLAAAGPSFAQFAPGPNPITGTVGAQTLSGGTGTVAAGGTISVSSGGQALSLFGTSTLVNEGTIRATASGPRAIDSNSGTANLTVTNSGLISSVNADAFRVNTAGTSVSLTNTGTIQVTAGGQAIDWANIATGTNTLTNSGTITAVGDDAVRPGQSGIVHNSGLIAATPTGGASPSGSDGIDLRTQKNVTVNNTGTISGRHGIATDGANTGPSSLILNNHAGIIAGVNGSGVNIDGVSVNVTATVLNMAGATIRGGVLAAATNGDGDGIDVDGILHLTNYGDVLGLGAKGSGGDGLPNHAQAISIGGGTIVNHATGRIIGSTLVADAPHGDPTRAGEGILSDNSSGGNAIAPTTVTNHGLIQGTTGAAIRFVSTFADTVVNEAGGIIRGSGSGAAIQSGHGANVVVNRGTIIGDGGNAIDLQGGDDVLRIEGGVAGVSGNISGGAGENLLIFELGAGNHFHYTDYIASFRSIEIASGVVRLDGAGRVAADAALVLSGGALAIVNAGANAQTFSALSLTGDSLIDLDQLASITFAALDTVMAGASLRIIDYAPAASPGYAFRFAGDLTGNADFLALVGQTRINGTAAAYRFDGVYTNVLMVPEPPVHLLLGLAGIVLLSIRRAAR